MKTSKRMEERKALSTATHYTFSQLKTIPFEAD